MTIHLLLRQRYFYFALVIAALIAVGLPLRGVLRSASSLPSPQEAIAQGEKLSAEELTQIEMDEVTRDRLRFDPAWQPIAEAIRQDIMILKWGDNQLSNPVWQRYGAKAYPLLDYYARSGDPTRSIYGVVGIRSLGKPYTTLWLSQLLQRQSENLDMYLLTANPVNLLNPDQYVESDPQAWQKEFGLDDPATRDRMVQLAKQNIKPAPSQQYEQQFNQQFLRTLLGDGAVDKLPPRAYLDPTQPLNTSEWSRLMQLTQLSAEDVQEAIAIYDNLPTLTKEYLLIELFGRVKAGEISPLGRAILHHVADRADAPEQIWAVANLDRHGDPKGTALLQDMINGNLSQLHELSRSVFYDGFLEQDIAKGEHAYYLLLGIVEKYPNSQFAKGCREYGDLMGRSYFGGEPRSKAILDRITQKTPEQRVKDWEQWMTQYPDHPGSDDAMYHKARGLQAKGDVMEAMRLWLAMMTQSFGDGDARYLAWPHVRTLLDVGLTTQQVQTLFDESQSSKTITPLLQYALAVRHARNHDYAKALQLTEKLDMTQMSSDILESYYKPEFEYGSFVNRVGEKQQAMQAMLGEQRQRWQQLLNWKTQNTPESRYEMAANWSGSGGWKNGYLPFWDGFRTYTLPQTDCEAWWVCDYEKRDSSTVQAMYQSASQNAIALSLYQGLLQDSQTPNPLREKALFMSASTLLAQWENYPFGETKRIHPPAGVQGKPNTLTFSSGSNDDWQAWEAADAQMQQDYLQRVDAIIAQLQRDFPNSPYVDDLLFSNFYLSGERRYLQQIIDRYPKGDRAAEAKFLLNSLS